MGEAMAGDMDKDWQVAQYEISQRLLGAIRMANTSDASTTTLAVTVECSAQTEEETVPSPPPPSVQDATDNSDGSEWELAPPMTVVTLPLRIKPEVEPKPVEVVDEIPKKRGSKKKPSPEENEREAVEKEEAPEKHGSRTKESAD
eukprot:NODE_3049_length_825_cov_49.811856_g2535_i0.p2 GENE.NODE_3049_length_825_cov_49.811856_g2535_i0~~NODE_3049_length_825_cov_49.811856_g2535_i0.p2  ORF type:complete len:145 (+),score=35.26 NODE_3049_length_825_cov_49.811856_g2535_i0:31-465(+)